MSVDLCDVDVDVYLLVVDLVVPFLLVDADLDGVDVANFSWHSLLDADVDAIHDFADSILDAHSNLDVDANLIVVDFLVVDGQSTMMCIVFFHSMLSRLLSLSLLMAIFSESMLLMHWPCWWRTLCLMLSKSMLSTFLLHCLFLMLMFFFCCLFFFDARRSTMLW